MIKPGIALFATLLFAQFASPQTNQYYFTYEPGTPYTKTNIPPDWPIHAKEGVGSEKDADAHWGAVTAGFRHSIRLSKESFTNGEPVIATIILRNVSDRVRTYLVQDRRDLDDMVVLTDGQKRVPHRYEPGPNASFPEKVQAARRGSDWHCELPKGTQRKFVVNLNDVYDLSKGGQYTVSATRMVRDESRLALTNVVSGKVTFSIDRPR